jgi:hypothetical protein
VKAAPVPVDAAAQELKIIEAVATIERYYRIYQKTAHNLLDDLWSSREEEPGEMHAQLLQRVSGMAGVVDCYRASLSDQFSIAIVSADILLGKTVELADGSFVDRKDVAPQPKRRVRRRGATP